MEGSPLALDAERSPMLELLVIGNLECTFGCLKMSDFVPNNLHLREVLIFFFHSKKTAAEAHRELQKVYGDTALSETTCRD